MSPLFCKHDPSAGRRRWHHGAARCAVVLAIGALAAACATPASSGDVEAHGRRPEPAPATVPTADRSEIPADEATTSTTSVPTTTEPPTTTTTAPPEPEADATLQLGDSGAAVQELQDRLTALGYWNGDGDGTYGQLTRQAVMAFQKVEGLGRDGVAGPATRERLMSASRPTPQGSDGLEIDLARQVLFMVEGGQVTSVINTSTGNGEAYTSSAGGQAIAATPPGQFSVQREIDGVREAPLGTLYRPKYFNGGIAVHGSGSIPAYPASHGCARVTNSAMDMIWSSGLANVGAPVRVY